MTVKWITPLVRFLKYCSTVILVFPVHIYRYSFGAIMPSRCRFYPSCSSYAVTALTQRGPIIGLALIVWRLLRCHPFNPGGFDPVPLRQAKSTHHLCHQSINAGALQ